MTMRTTTNEIMKQQNIWSITQFHFTDEFCFMKRKWFWMLHCNCEHLCYSTAVDSYCWRRTMGDPSRWDCEKLNEKEPKKTFEEWKFKMSAPEFHVSSGKYWNISQGICDPLTLISMLLITFAQGPPMTHQHDEILKFMTKTTSEPLTEINPSDVVA